MTLHAPLLRQLVVLGLVLGLGGCGQEGDDLDAYIAEVLARPSRPLEPIPEVEPYVPGSYVAGDLRDPFVPNEVFNAEDEEQELEAYDGPKPIKDRQREPLEAFPLDSLRMLGTITKSGEQYALIRSSEPLVYRIRRGQYMGQNHGLVLFVAPDHLVLKELFADGAGRWVERETTLSLSNTAQDMRK